MRIAVFGLAAVFLLLVYSACNTGIPYKKPPGGLDENTYERIFYEMAMLRVLQNYYPPADTVDSLNQLILDKYAVSGEDFMAAHRYYQSKPEKQLELAERVQKRLAAEIEYFNREDSVRRARADSIRTARTDTLSQTTADSAAQK